MYIYIYVFQKDNVVNVKIWSYIWKYISDLFACLPSVNSSMFSTQSALLRNLPRLSKTSFHFPPVCFLSSRLVFISLCYSVQWSRVQLFATPWIARPPCPSPIPGVYSNSCPLSHWCHPTISSSVGPFSSCLQSFPASGSFPISQFFASSGQSTGASASASVLPMNTQDWFPLGWTGVISFQSKGLSNFFFCTVIITCFSLSHWTPSSFKAE